MANKPAHRNWNDIQVVIATISMALTLVFWNLFAGPDRETALTKAQELASLQPTQPNQSDQATQTVESAAVVPTPLGSEKLLFGGSAPQTTVIVRTSGGGGGGGGTGAS